MCSLPRGVGWHPLCKSAVSIASAVHGQRNKMSRLSPRWLLVSIAFCCAVPAAARAQEDEGVRGVVHQRLVALLNPMGAEHELRLGLRAQLGDQDELLFGGAGVEAGLVSYFSPVYSIQGGYLVASPLSFLTLGVEFTHTALWAIPMDGAGYFRLDRYDVDLRNDPLTADRAANASGWTARVFGGLRGRIPLGPINLLIVDDINVQHDTLGDATHYYSQKHDLVLQRSDWVLHNDAVALVEARVAADLVLRGGIFSNLRFVPSSEYIAHQLGPILALTFERVSSEVRSITPFIRGAYYTHHLVRAEELTVLGGVSIDYDLGRLR